MIKNYKLLDEFNQKYIRENKRSYQEALVIYEALWNEAVSRGKLPPKNRLEGIEKDFRIAKALNHPDAVKNV